MGAQYIVTDLHVRARFDLSILHNELDRAGLDGWVRDDQGYWEATYSGGTENSARCPAAAIDDILKIVESLGPEARDQWNRCFSRRFDMGFEAFDDRFASCWQVNASLLRRIADLNGELVLTIYRADNPAQVN